MSFDVNMFLYIHLKNVLIVFLCCFLASFIFHCLYIYFTSFYYDVGDVAEWRNVGRDDVRRAEIYTSEFDEHRNDVKRGYYCVE